MQNIKLLTRILNHIKSIKRVSIVNLSSGKSYCYRCLIGNAFTGGIIKKNVANERLAFAPGFSKKFDVTYAEARDLLYLNDRQHTKAGYYTGQQYYNAGQKLLKKYGHSLKH